MKNFINRFKNTRTCWQIIIILYAHKHLPGEIYYALFSLIIRKGPITVVEQLITRTGIINLQCAGAPQKLCTQTNFSLLKHKLEANSSKVMEHRSLRIYMQR